MRWYALAYIAGRSGLAVLCLSAVVRHVSWNRLPLMTCWSISRLAWCSVPLGYVLFYNFSYYLENPLQILMVWHGGMAFHGGMLGTLVGLFLFARRRHQPACCWRYRSGGGTDRAFLRAHSDFINGELYGRATDMPWSMVFPNGGLVPRTPASFMKLCWKACFSSSYCAVDCTHRYQALSGCHRRFFLAG